MTVWQWPFWTFWGFWGCFWRHLSYAHRGYSPTTEIVLREQSCLREKRPLAVLVGIPNKGRGVREPRAACITVNRRVRVLVGFPTSQIVDFADLTSR